MPTDPAIYYKATRPDGTDFYTGMTSYAVGTVLEHWSPRRKRNEPSTYLSVATVPTDCTGFRWSCRLFAVEGVGRAMTVDNLPNKRCFSAVRVVEELPAWQVWGPQGVEVADLIDRARQLTVDEVNRLAARYAAPDAAPVAARYAARVAAWDAAWVAARVATWDAAWYATRVAARYAAPDATWYATWDATWDATWALVTRDLISADQFGLLYGPWATATEVPNAD